MSPVRADKVELMSLGTSHCNHVVYPAWQPQCGPLSPSV
jgi:hypothetical protein